MNKFAKIIFMVLFIISVLLNACGKSEQRSWYVGNTTIIDVKATFSNQTLTISGRGAIKDSYSSYPAPWYLDRLNILRLIIRNGITGIGNLSFAGSSRLTSVTIPNSITNIGNSAFLACSALTLITIGSGVTSIGDEVFLECVNLTNIEVSTDNTNYSSENGVLFDKNKTALIQYPAGKKGAYNIPDGVKSVGNGAFRDCAGLTSITIPSSVTSIGNSAFSACGKLTSITIDNVKSIGGYAFKNCSKLTSITIGSSVTSIGDGAFSECNELTKIISLSDTPPAANSAFSKLDKTNITLYVPRGSIKAYKKANGWKDFTISKI